VIEVQKEQHFVLEDLKSRIFDELLTFEKKGLNQNILTKFSKIFSDSYLFDELILYTYKKESAEFTNILSFEQALSEKEDLIPFKNIIPLIKGAEQYKDKWSGYSFSLDYTIISDGLHCVLFKDGTPSFYLKAKLSNFVELNKLDECLKVFSHALMIYSSKRDSHIEEHKYKQLFRVTSKFHSSINTDEVLKEIINTLKEVYPNLSYYLLLSYDYEVSPSLPVKEFTYEDKSENQAANEAYLTGQIYYEIVDSKYYTLYAPLLGKQGIYGLLQVILPKHMSLTDKENEFIELLAKTAGNALENAQLYDRSRKLISDLQLINETSHRLNSNLRLNEIITFMCHQIVYSIEAQEVGFVVFNSDDHFEVLPGSTDIFSTPIGEFYIRYSMKKLELEGDAVLIGDLGLESDNFSRYKSLIAVPMNQANDINGMAIVLHENPYVFSFEAFKLIQALIHHSTLAFTNAMLREELELLVVTDHLTKLYSRSYLDEKIQRSLKNDFGGTFIIVDIDNFKRVNDTYGHQVGDEILIQVSNIIKQSIRDCDIGARWGGEELAVYLPRASTEIGRIVAERLVQKVNEETEPKVSISCGVSSWYQDNSLNYKQLFNQADEALYIAKNTGKNRAVFYDNIEK
jgi:diguanylate cyclase (GGDEF)-like protein